VDRYDQLLDLAREYEEQGYKVLGIDEGYPGLLAEEVPEHELESRVGLLLSDSENIRDLKIVEPTYRSTLDAELLVEAYESNIDKAVKNANYFEDLGYEVEAEAFVEPCGDLKTLKEIYENTKGAFFWDELVDSVSEPGRLGGMKESGKIICEGRTETGSEVYGVNHELETVIDLFNLDVV